VTAHLPQQRVRSEPGHLHESKAALVGKQAATSEVVR